MSGNLAVLPNALGAAQPPAAQPSPLPHGVMSTMAAHTSMLASRADQMKEHISAQQDMKSELDKLLSKGVDIQPGDVMDAATRLIAHGADPAGLAATLAELPQGGEALSQWVMQRDQKVTQEMAQAKGMSDLAHHDAAVAGLHGLMADHIVHGPLAGAAAKPTAGNSPSAVLPPSGGANALTSPPPPAAQPSLMPPAGVPPNGH